MPVVVTDTRTSPHDAAPVETVVTQPAPVVTPGPATYTYVRETSPFTGIFNFLGVIFALFGILVMILGIYAGSLAGAGAIIDTTVAQGWAQLQALFTR